MGGPREEGWTGRGVRLRELTLDSIIFGYLSALCQFGKVGAKLAWLGWTSAIIDVRQKMVVEWDVK